MAHRLDFLFQPVGVDRFLSDYAGRRVLHLAAGHDGAARFAPYLNNEDWSLLAGQLAHALRADVTPTISDPVSQSRLLLLCAGSSECFVDDAGKPITLVAGDALYLPAHQPLRVETSPDARLQWMGLCFPTGADLLRWVLDVTADHELLKAELPLAAPPGELHQQLRKVRRVIANALRAPQLITEFERHLDNLPPPSVPSVYEHSTPEDLSIVPATGRPLQVLRAGKDQIYSGPARSPVIFAESAAGPLQYLAAHAPVTIREFHSAFAALWTRQEIDAFLRTLTESGLCSIGRAESPTVVPAVLSQPRPGPHGWLPVSIGFDHRAPLLTDAAVRWMNFRDQGLDDPFMKNTVERLREQTPPPHEIETGLQTLERLGASLPQVTPSGFIFHVSHCGSTLISNALKTAENVVVASEPKALAMLVRPFFIPMDGFLEHHWDQRRQRLIQAIFNVLATYRTGEPQPLAIKFPSVAMLSIPTLRRYFPRVPVVIVIRDPLEVMVANKPGRGWMQLRATPGAAQEMFGWRDLPRPIDSMPDEEFSARVLGSFFQSAAANLEGRVMLLDYTQLNAPRMARIGAFFGLDVPTGERLDTVMNAYAKDPEQKRTFRQDKTKKQWMATVMMRSSAEVFAAPGYRQLLQHALRAESAG